MNGLGLRWRPLEQLEEQVLERPIAVGRWRSGKSFAARDA